MQFKAIAVLVIIGLSILLFVGMRKENRADAAAGNCYAAAMGPSSPTVCDEAREPEQTWRNRPVMPV